MPQLEQLELPASKYSFTQIPDGFVLHREGGLSIVCQYADTQVNVNVEGVGNAYLVRRVPLYGDGLIDAIGDAVADIALKSGKKRSKVDRAEAKGMIKHALIKRLNEQMERVRKEVAPPDVTDLAKKMWSSVFTDARIIHLPQLYTEQYKYLYSDLVRYHACRLWAKYLETEMWASDENFLDNAAAWRDDIGVSSGRNKAINKTLDCFPHSISYHLIQQLRFVILDRPITTRLHMLAVLSAVDHHQRDLHMQTLIEADDAQIIAASEIIAADGAVWGKLTKRSKYNEVAGVMTRIFDYDQPYQGDLVGLARRSAQWHSRPRRTVMNANPQGLSRRQIDNPLKAVDTPTAVPPVNLEALKEQGVSLLDSVNAVIREAWKMDHCIAGYAQSAVKGECYLFHVIHPNGADEASVEVKRDGYVAQAYGPRDCKNEACSYGTEVLRKAFTAAGLAGTRASSSYVRAADNYVLMEQVGFLGTGERIVRQDGTYHIWGRDGILHDLTEDEQRAVAAAVNQNGRPDRLPHLVMENMPDGTRRIVQQEVLDYGARITFNGDDRAIANYTLPAPMRWENVPEPHRLTPPAQIPRLERHPVEQLRHDLHHYRLGAGFQQELDNALLNGNLPAPNDAAMNAVQHVPTDDED